jgi:aspartate kinase
LLDLVKDLPGDARERDLLLSCGELISAVVVAHELRAAGIDAVALSGAEAGIVTDEVAGNARIDRVYPATLESYLAQGRVPVVAGFQGISADGVTTTLGRGGSDTTAAALGVALKSSRVEIYTDVDGVMTADPRVVADAAVIESLTPEELLQMASMGSRVVHSPAAELALNADVPLYVKNTLGRHAGTRICDLQHCRPATTVTAITHHADIARFSVELDADEGSVNHVRRQAGLFEALAAANISLDMFTPAGCCLYFTVHADAVAAVREVLTAAKTNWHETANLAKVTVVGAGMHGVPGVVALVATTLRESDIDLYQIADSHATISVLVDNARANDAICALHAAFDL